MIRRIAITLAGVGAAAFLAASPAAAVGNGAEFEAEGWQVSGTVVQVGDIFVQNYNASGFEVEAEYNRR